jgi:endonuclease YncB( thermonuclease family)
MPSHFRPLVRTPSLALFIAALGLASLAFAADAGFTGKVVAVTDGDTFTVLDSSNFQHKIRLAGIDAPERKQAFGTKSREALAAMTFNHYVGVTVLGRDRDGCEIGRVTVGKTDVNEQMVREGMAWRYPQYDKRGEFTEAENYARTNKLGLWADPHPIPPWEFRKQKRAGSR